MSKGPWMAELKKNKIYVNDMGDEIDEIEILIGSNYYASLLTGRKYKLSNGLVALETCLGWTLSGELINPTVLQESRDNLALNVMSMFVGEASLPELWKLETIGIMDPVEQKSKLNREAEVKEHFLSTLRQVDDGRYCVKLPFTVGSPAIPNNRSIAERRLLSMTDKLLKQDKYDDYQKVFDGWLKEDFIEMVDETTLNDVSKNSSVYYLPHRAVFKPESLTTPIRPVFDGSCKTGNRSPSLNQLLEKGPNLLELLPTSLLRFRENRIGVSADIRKAFQMIEVDVADRDFLRFLWWKDKETKKIQVYRHKRVVFGLNCSPFLLAAVLEFHIHSTPEEHAAFAHKLWQSLYVDNCVTSVNSPEEFYDFKVKATSTLLDAKMTLRNWENSQFSEIGSAEEQSDVVYHLDNENQSKILGLIWNKASDTLSCDVPQLKPSESMTKTDILSYTNKIFDPLGFLAPAVLPLKLILQSTWLARLGWDEQLPNEAAVKVKQWFVEAGCLNEICIPRYMKNGIQSTNVDLELHTFCDASQEAYAAVVFLKTTSIDTEEVSTTSVQLIMAKSRLAPLKRPTIPRMELLACLIGARLTSYICNELKLKDAQVYLWTDSTTALSWIKRNDEWGTFIGNRVREICSLTSTDDWKHVSGVNNPADLPSRGCMPCNLLQSKWWEGPTWLYLKKDCWPVQCYNIDEYTVMSEAKMSNRSNKFQDDSTAEVNLLNVQECTKKNWYVTSSSYNKTIRVIA